MENTPQSPTSQNTTYSLSPQDGTSSNLNPSSPRGQNVPVSTPYNTAAYPNAYYPAQNPYMSMEAYYNYYYPQAAYFAQQQQYMMMGNPMQADSNALPPIPSTSTGGLCRTLYVGNLSDKVTEPLLWEIFSCLGPVESAKICKDKNTGMSAGYGFVEYYDPRTAALALQQFNGRAIYGTEIKVNWGVNTAGGALLNPMVGSLPGSSLPKEDTTNHFHIFVGDLAPDIDDKMLYNAFAPFGSISDARVMMDPNKPGHSRGYGFVAFRKREDAQKALTEMNGEWLGNRAIRCNWANQKTGAGGDSDSYSHQPTLDYNTVMNQSSMNNCTVYVGNATIDVSDTVLRGAFEEYGTIEEIKRLGDKGIAFVRFQTHDQATKAIIGVNGRNLSGKIVKCSWSKEKQASTTYPSAPGGSFYPQQQQPGYFPSPQKGNYY